MLAERDIDNAYWELPKEGVYDSVKQASQLVRAHRGMRGNFLFSIAKGGERSLDRIGEAAYRGFRAVPLEDVLKFVRWDLDHKTLFEMYGWVLNENIKGVPIGGFLSAQLMCIWALVQEITFMQNQVPIFREVRKQWDNKVWPKMTLTPSQQVAYLEVAWVPKDVSFFNSHGMDGWFEQTYKLVGSLTLDDHPITLRAMILWDSHPEGRLGHIIQSAPKTQHYFLRNNFFEYFTLEVYDCRDGRCSSGGRCLCSRVVHQVYGQHLPGILQCPGIPLAGYAAVCRDFSTHTLRGALQVGA